MGRKTFLRCMRVCDDTECRLVIMAGRLFSLQCWMDVRVTFCAGKSELFQVRLCSHDVSGRWPVVYAAAWSATHNEFVCAPISQIYRLLMITMYAFARVSNPQEDAHSQ